MAKRKLKCIFIVFVAKIFIKTKDEAKTFSEAEEQAPTHSLIPHCQTLVLHGVTIPQTENCTSQPPLPLGVLSDTFWPLRQKARCRKDSWEFWESLRPCALPGPILLSSLPSLLMLNGGGWGTAAGSHQTSREAQGQAGETLPANPARLCTVTGGKTVGFFFGVYIVCFTLISNLQLKEHSEFKQRQCIFYTL